MHRRLRTGRSEHAIKAGALGLNAGYALNSFKSLLPLISFAVEVNLNHVGSGYAVLQLDGCSQRHQFAVIHNGDAVAKLVRLLHVMSGEKHSQLARSAQVVEHLPDGDARNWIQSGRGLIKKKDARIVYQAARDFEPPPHATGESFGLCIAPLDQVNCFKYVGNVLCPLGSGNAVKLGVDAQVFFNGQVRIAGQRLGNDADHTTHVVRIFRHIVSGNGGLAAGEWNKRGHHADKRALAGAVRAEQAKDFAIGHREAHILDRFKCAVTLDRMFHLDGRRPIAAGFWYTLPFAVAALTASPADLWQCRFRPSCPEQIFRPGCRPAVSTGSS